MSAGESYKEAFEREMMEELRINVHHVDYKDLGALTPHQHDVSAFVRIYLLQSNTVPDYNRNDFVEFFWMYPQELVLRVNNGAACKDDVPKIIRHFFIT